MKPLVSVIVPVYNVQDYLNECIDSLISQTYKELEILLVDDGSPDRCGEICDNYAGIDSRIRVIHKTNGGLSDARNCGLDNANGDLISFIDSDDWIKPDMIEYLENALEYDNADISICNYIYTTDRRYKINYYEEKTITGREGLEMLFSDKLENFACNKMFRAKLWNGVRFPKGKNFEDILTIYKTFEKADKIVLLNGAKYYYRIRSTSISGARDFANRLHIYQAICSRYEENASKYPQYRKDLFLRIRKHYCHELSTYLIKYPEYRELYWPLLEMLVKLILEHKDEIYESCQFSLIERLKFNSFCECSIKGCKKTVFYHKLLKKIHKSVFA